MPHSTRLFFALFLVTLVAVAADRPELYPNVGFLVSGDVIKNLDLSKKKDLEALGDLNKALQGILGKAAKKKMTVEPLKSRAIFPQFVVKNLVEDPFKFTVKPMPASHATLQSVIDGVGNAIAALPVQREKGRPYVLDFRGRKIFVPEEFGRHEFRMGGKAYLIVWNRDAFRKQADVTKAQLGDAELDRAMLEIARMMASGFAYMARPTPSIEGAQVPAETHE